MTSDLHQRSKARRPGAHPTFLTTVDLHHLNLQPGDRVLDAGCGEGRHTFAALDHGAHVVALDVQSKMLCSTLAGIGSMLPHLEGQAAVVLGDLAALPFRDQTFDRIICSEVLEHVPSVGGVVRELCRVLKVGGTAGFSVPTATSEYLCMAFGRTLFEMPGGHVRIMSTNSLTRILAACGLSVVRIRFAHAFYTPFWMLRNAEGLPSRAAESRLSRWYRRFLNASEQSAIMCTIEGALNYIFPRSVVVYVERQV